jgi:heme oxygenase
MNMAMCHSFAERFSFDTKVLLERVAKQITGQEALQLIQRIREAFAQNDAMLKEIQNKANAILGTDNFHSLQKKVKQSNTLPNT